MGACGGLELPILNETADSHNHRERPGTTEWSEP